MKQMFGNATVAWSEHEIVLRENLIQEIAAILRKTWYEQNRAIRFERIETPILTPADKLQGHIEAKFELLKCEQGYLRPETTAGIYEEFELRFPSNNQQQSELIKKMLPLCLWQVGLSFRDETNPDTMRASKLRLRQFYQLEFELFAAHNTGAPYIELALHNIVKRFGGEIVMPTDLPHYSANTWDWHYKGLEVAGCSIRKDWKHGKVFEMSFGLDRLVALMLQG